MAETNKNEPGKFRVKYLVAGDLVQVSVSGEKPMSYKVVADKARVHGDVQSVIGHTLEAVDLRTELGK